MIQFKTKSGIFIQKNIHTIESRMFIPESYMQKAGDTWDISLQFFLDFRQNFMPEYDRVCQSMPECARVCQSLAKFGGAGSLVGRDSY